MSAYAKALSIDRQSQSALVGLARLHLIRAERDMARKILQQAEEFHPDDVKISDMLIALDLPRPWAEIKQASQIHESVPKVETVPDMPGEPIPTATLAEIYVKQGLFDKAIKIYQDIISQSPDNDAARDRVTQLQEQLSRKAEMSADEQPSEIDVLVVKQSTAETEVAPVGLETPVTSPDLQNVPNNSSPLIVFKSWLSAIKLGRTNV